MQEQQAQVNEGDVPPSFICPLSHEIMRDPVMDPEGNSYERSQIEAWLAINPISPITRSPLEKKSLVPNRALRDAIEEYLKSKNPNAVPNPAPDVAAAEAASPVQRTVKVSTFSRRAEAAEPDIWEVLVKVTPPEGGKRTPHDIACVVDVSGSMGSEATLTSSDGKREGHGLSLLDIVKHSVRTLISVLEPQDRLCLVAYSNTAQVIFGLTPMEPAAKARLMKQVDELDADGNTNLWDGLHTGLEQLRNAPRERLVANEGRLSALLLLTDGLPNVHPPRGEIAMLQRYRDQHGLNCTIHTFGFGYDINSILLLSLAEEGRGMYFFIPDSSFVGTTFVHCTANLLSTLAYDLRVSVEVQDDARLLPAEAQLVSDYQAASWGATINLGLIQYGQSRDALIFAKSSKPPTFRVTARFEDPACPGRLLEVTGPEEPQDGRDNAEMDVQKARLQVVRHLKNSVKEPAEGREAMRVLAEQLSKVKEPRVEALLADVKGQVTEALSRTDWFQRWGRHYLPSLARAHDLQQCSNFKDPGVQHYGGDLFKQTRDKADNIFIKLPPPKPTLVGFKAASTNRAPASMAVFHNRSNPCFHGDCSVLLADGSTRSVRELRKGDRVAAPGGRSAEVVCVVKTLCPTGSASLAELEGGLLVTPYHPVRLSSVSAWRFPVDIAPASERPCEAVYSFVLDSEHIMLINGIECAALGHGLVDDDVVRHEYFGSQRVLDDLRRMPGYAEGLVVFSSAPVVRRASSTLASGFDKTLVVTTDMHTPITA